MKTVEQILSYLEEQIAYYDRSEVKGFAKSSAKQEALLELKYFIIEKQVVGWDANGSPIEE